MEKQDLRDWAMNNIEQVLNLRFTERKMTKKLREQIAGDMAVIASNAYRMGYYARSIDTEDKPLTTDDFDFIQQIYLHEISRKIQGAGK
jgi:hypothetical protein